MAHMRTQDYTDQGSLNVGVLPSEGDCRRITLYHSSSI